MARRRKKPGVPGWHSPAQRMELVQLYLATGNLALTAATLQIPEPTARQWKSQPWFKQAIDEFRASESMELDAKLKKVVDKATDALLDRIENGDYQYDQKTGNMVRKPINARDASKVTTEMLDRRDILQGKKPMQEDSSNKTLEKLALLAQEFARFASATEIKQHAYATQEQPLLRNNQTIPEESTFSKETN